MPEQKKAFTEVVKCGHCGNRAPMEIVATYTYERPSDPEWSQSDNYQLLACPACNAVTLRSYYWHDAYDPDDVTFTTLYPSSAKVLPGLPVAVKRLTTRLLVLGGLTRMRMRSSLGAFSRSYAKIATRKVDPSMRNSPTWRPRGKSPKSSSMWLTG